MTKLLVVVLCLAFITFAYINAAPVDDEKKVVEKKEVENKEVEKTEVEKKEEEKKEEEQEYPDFAYACAKQLKITDEQLEDYYHPETRAEEYENDHGMKCFIHCTLEALKMMKGDKILYEETKARYQKKDGVMAQLFEKYYGKCLNVKPNLKDNCEIAYQLEVCSDEEHSQFNTGFQTALLDQ